MLRITMIVSLVAIVFAQMLPVKAAESREGVPGRRSGGGTRWTAPKANKVASLRQKFAAATFASRAHLPLNLRLKAFFGQYIA